MTVGRTAWKSMKLSGSMSAKRVASHCFARYAAATVAYALHFARREAGIGRTATTLLMAAALVHTFVIAMQTVEVGHVPISNPQRAVSTAVWLLGLSYLYLEVTTNERAMGVFVLAIVVVLQLIPTIDPGMETANPAASSAGLTILDPELRRASDLLSIDSLVPRLLAAAMAWVFVLMTILLCVLDSAG